MSQGGNSGVNFAGWMIGLAILAVLAVPLLCLAGMFLLAAIGSTQ
jgi:cytochrome c oxidase assembly factor CtaG